jgi:hypothetical protein
MKRVLPLFLGVLMLTAPAFAQAKAGDKATDAGKTLTAAGKVSAVTNNSVTVKGKDGEWKFDIDKATTVVATGASHKMAALGADKKPSVATEYVAVGDEVTVKYHDLGASKHAATVTVKAAATVKK